MLKTLKIRLNADIEESVLSDEKYLGSCLDSATKQVARYCLLDVETAKTELDDIIVEVALSLVRRFRAEGVKSENSDIENVSYITDVLEPFYPQLNAYKNGNNASSSGAWVLC